MDDAQLAGTGDRRIRELDERECWKLLAEAPLARLAFLRPDDTLDILPVNHLVHREAVYLRTGPDGKVEAVQRHPQVALEVDGQDGGMRWSVVLKGTAAQVTSESEIRRAGVARLVSWAPTAKHFVLRITPTTVTGRSFSASARASGHLYAVPVTTGSTRIVEQPPARADRPFPIPHYSIPSRPPFSRRGADEDLPDD